MSDKKSLKKLRKRARKILIRTLIGFGVAVALCVLAALALPALVSTDFARARIVAAMAKATGKPARLDALSLSWTDGLRLRGLSIGAVGADGQGRLDDPEFLASLKSLHVDASILAALRGDIRATFTLDGLRLHLPPKPEPPKKPLPELLREVFAGLNAGLTPLPMKLDAHLRADLTDLNLRLEPGKPAESPAEAPSGQAIEIHGMSLHAAAAGLREGPVRVQAALDLCGADGKPAAPVRLEMALADLLDSGGRIDPTRAKLTLAAQAPGVEVNGAGSLDTALKIDLRARLREVLVPAAALAPKPLPPALAAAEGNLAASLTLTRPQADTLSVALLVFADSLRAPAPGKPGKAIGPLAFSMLQEVELNLSAQSMRLPGSFEMKPGSEARWTAEITGIKEGKPHAALSIKPVRLNLAELAKLAAVAGALPPGVSLGPASLEIADIDAATDIPGPEQKPDGRARLRGLVLSAKDIARRDAGDELRLASAELRVDAAEATLTPDARGSAKADVAARLEGLRQTPAKPGAKPVAVRSVSVTQTSLRADALALDAAALFGLTGRADAQFLVNVDGVDAAGAAQIPALTLQARLGAELPAAKSATVRLERFDLSAPAVRVQAAGKKAVEAPLALRASCPDIRLAQGARGIVPAINGLRADLDLGAALRAGLEANLGGVDGRDASASGDAAIDAGRLLALAAPLLPPQAKGAGRINASWKLAAALPEKEAAASAKAPATLAQKLKALGFISQAEATIALDGLSLDWPMPAKAGSAETLHLRGLSTPRPLRMATRDGARESSLAGSLAFGPLESLPGAGRLDRPLSGLLTINAAQQGARSAQVSEALHLDGFELDQNLTLTADKLDQVLAQALDGQADPVAAALELMDLRVTFGLSAGNLASTLPSAPPSALPGSLSAKAGKSGKALRGQGRLEAGVEVRLAGGRSLAVSARLVSPGLDLALGPDVSVSGLAANVRLARRYSLAKGLACPGDAGDGATAAPLSEQVFDIFPAPQAAPAGNQALGRLLDGWAAPGAGGGTLGLKRLKLKSAGLPLDIHDIELSLDDSGPVPGLRAFRAGLLGGSVLGSAMVRKSAGRYGVDLDMAFTGIDPGRLFPDKAPRDSAALAETSGRVRLSAPLTAEAETLLRQLDLRADITKIGPRTLERMLYALDPEEKNETIVQQRRLMGMGYPRNLRVAAAYGNLSVTGAVDVKGFQLDLPPVDRLAIANLPLKDKLAQPLAKVPALLKLLDAASGSRICRDATTGTGKPGALRVVSSPATQGAQQ